MITPEWYSAELNHLKVHKELHESILRDIVRRLVKTDFNVSDSAAWQAEKLQQSGMVFDDVIAEIARRTDKSREEIKAAFVKASTDIFDFDDKELADAGYDAQQFKTLSPAMKRIVNTTYQKTFTEARNLTLTTAVTSQTAYIQAADLAYMKVESGAFTFQEAMRTAVKSAAVQGLNVVYPSGHVSSLDAAMRRALLTGLNQTTGKLQIMRAEELDNDIMEISAHYGARPSHAEWQGQLVSLSGQKGFLTLDDIGYGAVDGFMGANCRHSWNVFFYGLSKPRYSAEELEYYKNAEVEYNGEKMKAYEAQQKQRSMERAVKQSKSTLVAYDEAMKNVEFDEERSAWLQEFEKESVKLKNREAKLVDFCEQTGLQRDRFREQVFATNTMNGVKGFGKSTSAKSVWSNRKATILQTKPGKGDIRSIVNFDINSEQYANKFKDITNNEAVNETLLKCSKSILKSRNGTHLEELYLINAKSGKIETFMRGKQKNSLQINDKIKKILTTSGENSIIVLHNHPNNTSFSGADLKTMEEWDSIGMTIALAHDGTVYTISGLNKDKSILQEFKRFSKFYSFDKALESLAEESGFFIYKKR